MLKKFLNEVVIIVAGKQAEKITELLDSKNYINEFLIAKKLNITINQARNILYKLSDYGLVSSIRKKDKRKGWYTYFWKIEILPSMVFLRNIFEKRIEQINNQIKSRETREFYVCERCNIEFNEESALVYDFTCHECGNIFSRKDNTKVIKDLKKNSDKIKKELEFVEEEIKSEKEKLESRRLKEAKKEKNEKKKIREEKKTKKKTVKKLIKTKKMKDKHTKKNKIFHVSLINSGKRKNKFFKNTRQTKSLHIKKKIVKKKTQKTKKK